MRHDLWVGDRAMAVEVRRRGAALTVSVDGQELPAAATWNASGELALMLGNSSFDVLVTPDGRGGLVVEVEGLRVRVEAAAPGGLGSGPAGAEHGGTVTAPMPGKVVVVLVEEGSKVERGQGVVVIEAMKMENELRAPGSGIVHRVHVRPGQVVEAGAALVEVKSHG